MPTLEELRGRLRDRNGIIPKSSVCIACDSRQITIARPWSSEPPSVIPCPNCTSLLDCGIRFTAIGGNVIAFDDLEQMEANPPAAGELTLNAVLYDRIENCWAGFAPVGTEWWLTKTHGLPEFRGLETRLIVSAEGLFIRNIDPDDDSDHMAVDHVLDQRPLPTGKKVSSGAFIWENSTKSIWEYQGGGFEANLIYRDKPA